MADLKELSRLAGKGYSTFKALTSYRAFAPVSPPMLTCCYVPAFFSAFSRSTKPL